MNNKFRLFTVASLTTCIFPGMALAAVLASALTDLNIRSGPGPEYPIIGFIRSQDPVTMVGCIEGSLWCQVTHKGQEGWAYSQYLATQSADSRVIVSQRPPGVIPTVTYTTPTTGAAVATGAVTGALIAGPVGAVGGGVAGAALVPPQQVQTYVTSNPGDPVYLDGEVVVGAGLPEPVQLRPVPDYNYRYAYVNGQRVLVDPASRRIVYIYR